MSAHNREPDMRPHTADEAAADLDRIEIWQTRYDNALGRRLAAHVLLEERGLFPEIEKALSADALERLGAELERGESRAPGLDCRGGGVGDSVETVR